MVQQVLTFNLFRVLDQVVKGKIPFTAINPALQPHQLSQWHAFAKELMRMKGYSPGRYDFDYVDRTGAMPSVLSVPANPIPKYNADFLHRSFADVVMARSQELLDQDKTICVQWSGGLDSTLALISLVLQAKNRDQIEIQLTWESICEAGSLFDQIVRPWNLQMRFDQTRLNTSAAYTGDRGDEIYVNGACGDQLFGRPKFSFRPKSPFNDHWSHGYSQAFLDIVTPSIGLSPRPIETKRDLIWWMFFNFSWNTVKTDSQIMRPAHVASRCVSFYDSWDFQQWAVSTNTYHDTTPGYRLPQVQALQSLIDHDVYCTTKDKSNSVAWMPDACWYMMDTDFNNYYTDD
jgi:hypothetical protein